MPKKSAPSLIEIYWAGKTGGFVGLNGVRNPSDIWLSMRFLPMHIVIIKF